MNDTSGSQWRKWDLHFHTPKSYDHKAKSLTPEDLVKALKKANVEVVAVTDHHVMDVEFIQGMQQVAGKELTVLPGIELSSNLGGGDGVHFIAIFPEDCNLTYTSNELLVHLKITHQIENGSKPEELYVDFPTAAKKIRELRGIITIHGHGKSNNYEGISSTLKFKQAQKTDMLREYVDIIEVGRPKDVKQYHDTIFPDIGFGLPIITATDNHNANEYDEAKLCWIKADPTFVGLKMAIREPQTRFSLGEIPHTKQRVESNATKYIQEIQFKNKSSMPNGEKWMQGCIPLNPGLIAVIGNKGSGKSALADCLGLLGSCTTSSAFSFLTSKRFRDDRTGRAKHMEATIKWRDGDTLTRCLDEKIETYEIERVKYLPQNFVERICNDIISNGESDFEKELKQVVFSKIENESRLEKHSLDSLIEYKTLTLRQKSKSLIQRLREISTERAELEKQRDDAVKFKLENKIDSINKIIQSHLNQKPLVVAPPEENANKTENQDELKKIDRLKGEYSEIKEEISVRQASLSKEKVRLAEANKLRNKLCTLRDDINRTIQEIKVVADELSLDLDDIITFRIDTKKTQDLIDSVAVTVDELSKSLSDQNPEGLVVRSKTILDEIKEAQDKLARPLKKYQDYLDEIAAWKKRSDELIGSEEDPDSLRGIEKALADLEAVPGKIETARQRQLEIAKEIHATRLSEVEIYEELYGPVQTFVLEHPLAKDHLDIEFRVELAEKGFVDSLLDSINQNRAGSFYGIDEGRKEAENLTSSVNWRAWEKVEEFLQNLDRHLHHDMRFDVQEPVSLEKAMGKNKTVADLYAMAFSLDYLSPKYILRWDKKNVAQLSAGERGTLLLIFYLLIDDSDMPLIVDQPEANLDNLTVASRLVGCIREARDRRQIVIVTHNPNLAVVCDADQIIHAEMNKANGNEIKYTSGGLEHPEMNRFAIEVLEGGRTPFDRRDSTYKVSNRVKNNER